MLVGLMTRSISSIAGGYALAAATNPALPSVDTLTEKLGLAGVCGAMMWWILGKLSKQMDEHKVAIERQTEAIDRLSESVRSQ